MHAVAHVSESIGPIGGGKEPHRIVTLAPGGPLLESPILSRVEYYHGLRNLALGDRGRARLHLVRAVEGDPSLVRAHLLLAYVYLRDLNPRWILTALEAFQALQGNFRSQSLIVANIVIYGLLLAGILLNLAVAVVLLRALPRFRHILIESLPPSLPKMVREAYPPVILCSLFLLFHPWIWAMGMVWVLSAGLLLMWRGLGRWERGLGAAYGTMLVLLPVLIKLAVGAALPATPGSALFALAGSPIAPLEREGPASLAARSPGDSDILFSLAMLERERGNLPKALRHYREVLATGNRSAEVYNNMANLLFLMGRPDDALSSYEEALVIDNRSATSHYNLGQLYLESFDFDHAREEFTIASELNFAIVGTLSRLSHSSDRITLVDNTLPAGHLWARFLAQEGEEEGLTWGESLDAVRRALYPFPIWGGIPPVLLLVGAGWFGRKVPRSGTCHRCGRTICRKCRVREDRKDVCQECAGKNPEPTWALRTLQYHRPVALSLGILFPGAAHLYLGRYAKAVLILFGTFGLLLVWAFRGAILKPFPILSAPGLVPLENMLFGWIFAPLYVFILVDTIVMIHKHFSGDTPRRGLQ